MSTSPEIPRLEWDDFLARFDWRQGQHVTLIGPTGSGKTTLSLAILPRRQYVFAFGTKKTDKTLDALIRSGWPRIKDYRKLPDHVHGPSRYVFWPASNGVTDLARQAHQIGTVCNYAYQEGGWCLYFDELWFAEKKLGLHGLIEWLYTQARSEGVSIVGATQRPAHITLLAYDQPSHLFFWSDNDEANLKRIAGMNGANSRLVRETVASLDEFEVLYVRTRSPRWMARTTPPAP